MSVTDEALMDVDAYFLLCQRPSASCHRPPLLLLVAPLSHWARGCSRRRESWTQSFASVDLLRFSVCHSRCLSVRLGRLLIAVEHRLPGENFAVREKYVRFGEVWQNCELTAVMLEKTLCVIAREVSVCRRELRADRSGGGEVGYSYTLASGASDASRWPKRPATTYASQLSASVIVVPTAREC